MKSKIVLWLIFTFTLIHFLKDITQDILKISTPLDLLGNVNEDLSKFPKIIKFAFLILGYLSFIAEAFLIVSIPIVTSNNNKGKLRSTVWLVISILSIYFLTATFLDPRFKLK